MKVLVTGGAKYIGTHTLVELLGQGHEALVVDSFANSSPKSLDRVRELTNGHFETEEVTIRPRPRMGMLTDVPRWSGVSGWRSMRTRSTMRSWRSCG